MLKLNTRHLKTGEELSADEILGLIDYAIELKRDRKNAENRPILQGKHLALLFDKPSLRTRFSFTVAMSELGGSTIESASQTRKHEEPGDLARVLSGYCHAIMIRTHEDSVIDRMAAAASVPVINGLSQHHHPCQIFADLMTLQETYSSLKGLTLSYIGDGNNILHSLLLLAPKVGVSIRYSCPKDYQPDSFILKKAKSEITESVGTIVKCATPEEAVLGANAVYTDVWTSMGFETEKTERDEAFDGYQLNEELMEKAASGAIILHCLPMVRGKEISHSLPDSKNSVIFRQSENRLHIQKALLVGLL